MILFSKPSLAMMLRQGVSRPGISLDKSVYLGDSQQVHSIMTIFSHALTNLDLLYKPIERALSEYKRPSLVGWGDKDPFFSVDQGRRTADLVNGAFSLYKDAGHFTPEECVDEIVEDLLHLVK
jgi:pimeloyl-ACP methyl ester carboxylesterase